MGGNLSLDENYDSGIPGCPGTRITFCLKASSANNILEGDNDNTQAELYNSIANLQTTDDIPILPEGLSVLFVDDDAILRKLFARVIRTVAPTWTVRQASNGETALHLTDTENFDLIFMDMYMASVEKQLLGTETVVALRAKGITSRICGLSANDKEVEFLDAGADSFLFKPFPCEETTLTRELCRILSSKDCIGIDVPKSDGELLA
jgi:CheY-like chemotaxis protein